MTTSSRDAAAPARPPSMPGTETSDWSHAVVLYHPRVPESRTTAEEIAARLRGDGARVRVVDAWGETGPEDWVDEAGWIVALGGDGTVLRVARLAATREIPVIGVNFGRMGFLAEIEPEQALEALPQVLAGQAEVDERVMLRCTAWIGGEKAVELDAVNDIFVGRGTMSRPVRLDATVDGAPLARYFADGLIVATPTGSTAYSLSAGGPVVAPSLDALVMTAVVPHPVPVSAIVLPEAVTVEVTVHTDYDAILSLDGQHCRILADGDRLRIERSPLRARFLRLAPANTFYASLMERLQRGKTTPAPRRSQDG